MASRTTMARQAIAAALRTRRRAGYDLFGAICVYDLAQRLGIEVRFIDIPSLEGMLYMSTGPTIILSSLRPAGRRAFTCAHELGHYINGDGTHVDELDSERGRVGFDPKEFAADCFAGALLMPKSAVERAFAVRGWQIPECSPDQVYVVSGFFGVGYATLVHHMHSGLNIISVRLARQLLQFGPRHAQARAVGWDSPERIWIVDDQWTGRAVDVEVGDQILLQNPTAVEGDCVEFGDARCQANLLRAVRPGIGRLESASSWSTFVRVARSGFVGRSLFRHLPEDEDERCP